MNASELQAHIEHLNNQEWETISYVERYLGKPPVHSSNEMYLYNIRKELLLYPKTFDKTKYMFGLTKMRKFVNKEFQERINKTINYINSNY